MRRIVRTVLMVVLLLALAEIIYGAATIRARRTNEGGSSQQGVQETDPAESGAGDRVMRPVETLPAETMPDETQPAETQSPEPLPPVEIDPSRPMVALTFDDGPSSTLTPQLLDILRENNAHATFFVVGYNLAGREDIVRRVAAEGHEIGSHTYHHPHLRDVDDAQLDEEIAGMRQAIVDITGQQTVVIRPPYGEIDERVEAHISDPVILWSVDSRDWEDRNPEMIFDHIQNDTFDGAIILMHDIHEETIEAAASFIPWLIEQGYQLVTVSELGQYRRGGLQTGIRYGSLPPQEG